MKYLRLLLLTLTLLLLTNVSFVMAQGAITDDDVQFVLGNTPFDSSPVADLRGVSANLNLDQLLEAGWWFRVNGDTQETFFPVPTTQNYVANTATLGWASLAGGLFSAQLQWIVNDDDGPNGSLPSGSLQGVMTITNLSAVNSLTLNLFNMADFDLKPSAQSDRAVVGPDGIRVFSSGNNTKARARYIGVGADNYLVRPDGATDVGAVLSDTGVTNFDNSGLPFGPGDFTSGWQWKDRVIPPSGTLTVVVGMTVNGPVDLKLTKTASGSTAANENIFYSLGVSNVGMSAATGVTLTETVPANTTFNPGPSSAGWACAPDNNAGSICTLSVGTVDLATSANFNFVVTVIASPTSSTITNTASVADDGANGTDSDPANNTATAVLSANPTISKTDNVTTATQGAVTTYTIVASNGGLIGVTGATVADTFPAACSSVSWTCAGTGGGTCTAGPTTGNINDTVNLPAGSSVTYTAVCQVSPTATGTLSNTATLTATPDADLTNNSATDTTTIVSLNPAITKTDGATTAVQGGLVTYTIVASNSGLIGVTGATVADTFPAACSSVSWTCAGTGGGTCTAGPTTGNINDTVNLPAGSSVTYTAVCQVSPTATGTLSNTATLTATPDADLTNNSATDTTTIVSLNPAITKTDGATTAVQGGLVTYTIVASNSGLIGVTGATVADTFPAACSSVSWTCAGTGGGTCTAGPTTGNINDTVNLPAGSSVTYTAVCQVSPTATGTLSNTATLTATPDVDPTNNSATDIDTLIPSADLSITKTDGVSSAAAGGTVTYTILVSNAGPSAVIGATVADTFPAACSTVSWTCAGTGGGTCTAGPTTGNINDTVSLPNGASVTYTAICTISASATGTLANTATVTAPSGVGDLTPGNNSATDTDTLAPCVSLATLTPPNQMVNAGGGAASVNVTVPTGCAWTAGNNVPWVTITSGSPGNGSGTVAYSVAANAGPNPRRGSLTIAGKTFIVSQRTPVPAPCTITLTPTSSTIGSGGGTGSVTITASTGSCQWRAQSHVPWITITSEATGSGSGTVQFSVEAGGPRAGRITVNGKRVTITQN